MITTHSLIVRERLAKQLLVAESSDELGHRRAGSTPWDKLSEGYRDVLRRKAASLMEVLND